MRQKVPMLLSMTCAAALVVLTGGFAATAQEQAQQDVQTEALPPGVKPYNPYPPDILPPDILNRTEIKRVQREVRGIFKEALKASRALPPLTLSNTQGTGNPPTFEGTGYLAIQTLGKLLLFDENMSVERDTACNFCHMPYAAFSGPIPSVNLTMIAYPGSFAFRANKRTAQRYTYSPYFPVLTFNEEQMLFFGGNFWDARATGYRLQNPDAEQAQHPPVDPGEMQFPDTACIALRLGEAPYRSLFETVWGAGSLDIKFPPDAETICSTPGGTPPFPTATPIKLKPAERTKANDVYDRWGQSISFYEDSTNVSAFSSKFDAFLAGNYTLTADEAAGYKLFRGQAACNTCHLDNRGSTQTPGTGFDGVPSTTTGTDTSQAAFLAPLFTCFGYANEGLPLNPRVALFYETTPDFFGFTPNPLGFGYRDLGLGTFLRSGPQTGTNPNADWISLAPSVDGQFQVQTARNVAMTPPQCPTTEAPGPYFQKEFFHNGYIKSLKQLVHFYNTRDIFRKDVTSGNCPAGTTEKVDCWPMPEVLNNIDMTTGNLGLTDKQENQIVAFLQTLTDGFTTPYPDSDTFTGQCMTGGTAATQGNEFLIPTPPLPSCATEICGVPPFPVPPIP